MCNYFADASRGTRDCGEIDAMGRWVLAADCLPTPCPIRPIDVIRDVAVRMMTSEVVA